MAVSSQDSMAWQWPQTWDGPGSLWMPEDIVHMINQARPHCEWFKKGWCKKGATFGYDCCLCFAFIVIYYFLLLVTCSCLATGVHAFTRWATALLTAGGPAGQASEWRAPTRPGRPHALLDVGRVMYTCHNPCMFLTNSMACTVATLICSIKSF